MASACHILFWLVLCILAISAARATDSEVVEAVTDGSPNEPAKMKMEATWNSSGSMQVQPYNILAANCPEGYVLANKHCHKRILTGNLLFQLLLRSTINQYVVVVSMSNLSSALTQRYPGDELAMANRIHNLRQQPQSGGAGQEREQEQEQVSSPG